jgi:hypothetical protein
MEAEFNVAYRLLFSSADISNFCKAFVYMKARAERDARLRIQLENGVRVWELNNNETFLFRHELTLAIGYQKRLLRRNLTIFLNFMWITHLEMTTFL